MKRYRYCIGLVLLLAGCAPAAETTETLGTDLKDNVYQTTQKVKEWATTKPPPKGQTQDVVDSYCYHVLQDILCYHQPMPGWENRLAGYQGSHAKTPAPATMQLLAKSKEDDANLPVNRVVSSKPVFTTLPTLPKESDKSSDQSAGDASHEILSDPALAPEL